MKNLKLKFDYENGMHYTDDIVVEFNTNKFNIEIDKEYIRVGFDLHNIKAKNIFRNDLLEIEIKTENFNFFVSKNSTVWKYFSIIVTDNEIKIPKNIVFEY
jgi:hypothetical protein